MFLKNKMFHYMLYLSMSEYNNLNKTINIDKTVTMIVLNLMFY